MVNLQSVVSYLRGEVEELYAPYSQTPERQGLDQSLAAKTGEIIAGSSNKTDENMVKERMSKNDSG